MKEAVIVVFVFYSVIDRRWYGIYSMCLDFSHFIVFFCKSYISSAKKLEFLSLCTWVTIKDSNFFFRSSQEAEKRSHKSGGGPPVPLLSPAPGHTAGAVGREGAEPNPSSLSAVVCVVIECCAFFIHGRILLFWLGIQSLFPCCVTEYMSTVLNVFFLNSLLDSI